ncbi:MAG: tetratricopeptide repeat protein [Proteobacteria bacterium]|nr:tetratricopeptide repeat protein [Pseudomonadota bacterium]
MAKFKVRDQLALAEDALRRADRNTAEAIWRKLSNDHPAVVREERQSLAVLKGLRRFEEAEQLMREQAKRHPSDSFYLQGLLEIAAAQNDPEVTLERAAALRKRFPGALHGYIYAAMICRQVGRLDEAEAFAREAMERFPEAVQGYLEHARIAGARQDWPEALQRWQVVLDRFDHQGGYIGAAEALVGLKRFDDADRLVTSATIRFPMEWPLFAQLARSREERGDVAGALPLWRRMLERFPLETLVYYSATAAFERMQAWDDLEATLRMGVDRFPDDFKMVVELARFLHTRRGDYAAAAEVWASIRAQFPHDREAYGRGAEAAEQIGRTEEAAGLRAELHRRSQAA